MTLADAVAETCRQSHVELVTAVPGHGATETYAAWQERRADSPPFSFHEEVAVGMAHGAALLGHRSVVLLKAHGFLKAGNAVADSLATGTTAGLLYVVFHDPTGAHSDSVLEVEGAARELGLPVHRPDDHEELAALSRALRRSEHQQLPHLLILPAERMPEATSVRPKELDPPTVAYERDAARHVCCPLLAQYQHAVFEARRAGEDPAAVARPAVPSVPAELPDRYRTVAERYRPLLQALADRPRAVAAGDTSVSTLFALPPVEAIDISTYMGGSLPLALGAQVVGERPAWAVSGDFGFVSAGHLGLLEAQQREVPLTVLLLENGQAGATGGQPVPTEALDTVLAGYSDRVRMLTEPETGAACRQALDWAAAQEEGAIVRARYENERPR